MDCLRTTKPVMCVKYNCLYDPEAWYTKPSPEECKPLWTVPMRRPLITFSSTADIYMTANLNRIGTDLLYPIPGRSYLLQGVCNQEKAPCIPMYLMIPFEETQRKETCCKYRTDGFKKITQTPECVHRDGLQDDCPLSQCQNQPECFVKPWPNCLPAQYLQSRHPEQYPSGN
ncbi:hypothetical protein WN48_03617 [Eufriesea mexicana]|nr:hypothetical protein WN48_03617 [Eufriesea mexicana]